MLLRIHQVAGAHAGRMWTFDQPVVRLGRMPDSDIVFDAHADLDASGRHAEFGRQGDQWVVRDVGSRNGTFVNGARVEEQLLSHGDVVECGFGGPRVRVELVAPREASGTPSANTAASPMVRPNAPTGLAEALPPASGDAPTAGVPSVAPAVPAPSGPSTGPLEGAVWGGGPGRGGPGPAGGSRPAPPAAPGPAPFGIPTSPSPPNAPQPSASPQAAGAGEPKRYGQRTVGMMVDEALQALRREQQSGQRKWKIFAGCLAALLGLVCLGVAAILLLRPKAGPPPDVAAITAANGAALWSLQGADGTVFCTAFAVRRDLLATSGRCVLGIERRQAAAKPVSVVAGGASFPVSRMWRHPETPLGPELGGTDVGLVEIAGPAPALVTLATPGQVGELVDGSTLLVHGYSTAGALALPITLQSGDGPLRYADSAPFGAPLLDASGMVVGIHTGDPVAAVGPGQGVGVAGLLGLLAGLGR